MSEHDAAPDPIDEAYRQSEALLTDDDARARRRARVLSAVASAPATRLRLEASPRHSPAWRRGGWLAAAGVAGFGLFWAAEVDRSSPRQTPSAPSPAFVPAAPSPSRTALPPSSARAVSTATKPTSRKMVAASPTVAPPLPPPPASGLPAPAVATMARASRAFPGARALAPAAVPPPDIAAAPLPLPPVPHPQAESVGPPQPAPPAPPAPRAGLAASEDLQRDWAERLRAAAATSRLAEIQALLAQGALIDEPDSDGNTALMDSIKADQPAAAALLRAHGADLDQKNRAGLSARDMAMEMHDPALRHALGLDK
jgi:hypothetical protein